MKKLSFLLLSFFLFSCQDLIEVDLIVHNGTIHSVDPTMAKFEAMAIKAGKIVELGAENQILNRYISSKKVDVKKQHIYPGFIDAHCHFLGYGVEKNRINLVGTKSFDEMIQRIKQYADSTGADWILGRGWDQNKWPSQELPSNDTLSKLFPDKFIAVKRVDGHAFYASSNVLELAGIDEKTIVPGGKVLVKNQKPTGVVIDAAMSLINEIIPKPSKTQLQLALLTAQKDCFKHGLTTVSDAGLAPDSIAIIQEMQEEDELKMRVYAMISASNFVLKNMASMALRTDRLDVRAIKIYADGALGSRGALMIEPYHDDTLNHGLLITEKDSLIQWAKACFDNNFQMNVHCIGDGANSLVLQVMADQLKHTNDRRWRIEHAQVVAEEDQSKFSQFNIIPSVQPTHATSDMEWAVDRLGKDRIHTAYAYQTLVNQNGLIALGTDFPVEDISTLETFYAAVTRKNENGEPTNGFHSEEALTREQAIKGMTIWAAIANFEDSTRGSLEVGKFADFTLLDTDLLTCDESEILNAEILQTWVNGEKVYEKN